MTTATELAAEKTRISDRIKKLDGELDKLTTQLEEITAAERVMSRLGGSTGTTTKLRGRPRKTSAAPAAVTDTATTVPPATTAAPKAAGISRRKGSGKIAPATISTSDAVLEAVGTYPAGATNNDVMSYLSTKYGISIRPNHMGISLQRHRRAGRLAMVGNSWYTPENVPTSVAA
jgi:hypothetical protein